MYLHILELDEFIVELMYVLKSLTLSLLSSPHPGSRSELVGEQGEGEEIGGLWRGNKERG